MRCVNLGLCCGPRLGVWFGLKVSSFNSFLVYDSQWIEYTRIWNSGYCLVVCWYRLVVVCESLCLEWFSAFEVWICLEGWKDMARSCGFICSFGFIVVRRWLISKLVNWYLLYDKVCLSLEQNGGSDLKWSFGLPLKSCLSVQVLAGFCNSLRSLSLVWSKVHTRNRNLYVCDNLSETCLTDDIINWTYIGFLSSGRFESLYSLTWLIYLSSSLGVLLILLTEIFLQVNILAC